MPRRPRRITPRLDAEPLEVRALMTLPAAPYAAVAFPSDLAAMDDDSNGSADSAPADLTSSADPSASSGPSAEVASSNLTGQGADSSPATDVPAGDWPLGGPARVNALLVTFVDGLSPIDLAAILNPYGAYVASTAADGPSVVVLGSGVDPAATMANLQGSPGIAEMALFTDSSSSALTTGGQADKSAGSPSYGINLLANASYSSDVAWMDARHIFRPWGQADKPWIANPALTLTPDGYPLSDAGTLSYLPQYANGVYKLSYTGTAKVSVSGMGKLASRLVTDANGVTSADVYVDHRSTAPFILAVKNVDPNDPFRNFHLIAPGVTSDPTGTFQWRFLHRIAPFSSIRFMDWSRTNGSPVKEWADRTQPDSFLSTGPTGVAYEDMITLANVTGKDIWINIPDQASDDFVKHLADLFRDTLRPDVTIRFEYSNEVWNPIFPQYHRALAAAWANPDLTHLDNSGRVAEQYAARSKEIGDVFRAEFGAASTRLQPVMSGQATNPYFLSVGLDYLSAAYGAPSQYVSAIAVAPYAMLSQKVDKRGLTLPSLFASLNTYVTTRVAPGLAKHSALADSYGLQLLSYEGGQSVINWNAVNRRYVNGAVKALAQNDPRMGDLIRSIDSVWRANGGGLFTEYGLMGPYNKFGYWGLLQGEGNWGSVKWDAMMGLALPAGDATLDNVVDYSDFLVLKGCWGQSGMWWEQGDFNHDGVVNRADLTLLLNNATGLDDAEAADVAAFSVANP